MHHCLVFLVLAHNNVEKSVVIHLWCTSVIRLLLGQNLGLGCSIYVKVRCARQWLQHGIVAGSSTLSVHQIPLGADALLIFLLGL
jgi:hypothetical protein